MTYLLCIWCGFLLGFLICAVMAHKLDVEPRVFSCGELLNLN